jgi:TP901 family phage tail tape measure protein
VTTTTQWILELIDKVSVPMKKVGDSTDKASDGFARLGVKSKVAKDAIKSEMPQAARAIELLTNPYVAAAAGAAALAVAGYKVVSMASDWRSGMAKINVTAQLTQDELQGLSDKLLKIGQNNVADIEQIPDAFNKIISAGLDVKTSLDVLDPSLKAAKAGFADIGDVAKAAVSVMNSSGEEINKVYDTLFATLNKGNAEFSDISQYLPKIIPGARNAGFALGETAGAWAYLTAQGQTAERATTLMDNAMKSLADPTKIKAFKQMGIELYDNAGKIKPLTKIIEDLSTKTQGLSDLSRAKFFGKLGLDMEAASFFSTATQDVQKFKDTIDFTTNSQGQLNEAYKNSMTPLDHWHEITNILKGEMIKLGEKALPIINAIGEKVLGVIRYFQNLYKQSALFRDILSGIGTAFEWAFKIAIIPIVRVWNILKDIGSAIGWVISKIPGMGGGFEGMYAKVRPYFIWIKDFLGQIANVMYKIATFDFSGAVKAVKDFKMPSIDAIKAQIKVEADKQAEADKTPSSDTKIKTISTKLTKNDLNLDKSKNDSKSLGGSGGSSIKNISQKIEIKNYFSLSNSAGSSELDGIAEKVVRSINDKLRDAMVAAS